VLLARFDSNKGAPSLDQTFRAPGATVVGISFDRQDWPHGKGSRAIVHGALFGPLICRTHPTFGFEPLCANSGVVGKQEVIRFVPVCPLLGNNPEKSSRRSRGRSLLRVATFRGSGR